MSTPPIAQPPPVISNSSPPPSPIPEATPGTSFTSSDVGNGGGKKRRTLVIVGIVLGVLVLGTVAIITALRLQEIGPEPVAPTAPAPAPAVEPEVVESRCGTGSFTTSGGQRYCFVANNSVKTVSGAREACQQYGTLASFLDGETKQDVLNVISRFREDRANLYRGVSGGDPDDGAYIADSCNQFVDKFGDNDDALYVRGKVNCSAQNLSLGRSNEAGGKINDTGVDGGRGAVCQLAAATPSPSPSSSPSPSPSPSASASPSPSPAPVACQGSCVVDTDCEGALICVSGSCVNSLCPNDGDCTCDLGGASPTPTPTPTPTPSAAPRVSQPTSGDNLPEAGVSGPTLGLFGAGVATVLLGVLVLLL